ncbi:hypothetical protein MPSI1_001943 [Malassezia psittaci]|uniref:Mediator of RNA polymerase II transcription subunit 21 n=1 Tax=Malassezia psittaci TaxID=1821823 RepID=A0AAF0FEN0_9BASI|nr:hypothetical protein MPSI1_001943 [Malassezia psittaci]
MDPILQVDTALDTLLKIMASAIAYLSRKASHKQVNSRVPVTVHGSTEALSDEALEASRKELIHDLIAQAKELEHFIDLLPALNRDEQAKSARLESLQDRLLKANAEYRTTLQDAPGSTFDTPLHKSSGSSPFTQPCLGGFT